MPYPRLREEGVALPGERRHRCQCTTARGTTCRLWSIGACAYQVSSGRPCTIKVCRVHRAEDSAGVRCAAHAGLQAGLFTGLL